MVGRGLELAAITDAFHDCLAGRVRWVVVSGDAGLGKTRLITELTRNVSSGAEDVAAVVAVGQCVDLGDLGSALIPVREILRELLRRFGLTAVAEAAGRSGQVLASLLPELGDATDVDPAGLRDGVALLLETLSAMRPLVVVVEDAHWADPATITLLRGLAWTSQEGCITMVVTFRPEELDHAHPLDGLLADLARTRQPIRVELDPLTLAEVREQASGLLGTDPDPVGLRQMYERSGGVPFFVEELARWGGDPGLPETVRNPVLSHYQQLSPSTRRVLRLIATGGTSVAHDVVAAAFDGDAATLDEAAREAVEAQLLLRDPQRYIFRHALLREAILEESVPGERIRNHAELGNALSPQPDGRRAEIAHHWIAAHEPPKAFEATIGAIGEARALGAFANAATLGEQAIQLWSRVPEAIEIAGGGRIEMLHAIARDWHMATNRGRALETLAAATGEITRADSERLVDLLQLKSVLQTEQLDPEARVTLAEAEDLMPPPEDNAGHVRRAKVLSGLAMRAVMDCDYKQARELASAAAEEALTADDPDDAGRALAMLGLACVLDGDVQSSETAFSRAWEVDPSPLGVQRLAWFEGDVRIMLGDAGGAAKLAQHRLASSKANGTSQYWGPPLCVNAAQANLNLGDVNGAAVMIAEGSRLLMSSNDPTNLMTSMNLLTAEVRLSHWCDDLAQAGRCLATLGANLAASREADPADAPVVSKLSAQVALASGALDAAWAAIVPCLGERRLMPFGHLQLTVVAAEVLARLRRAGRAPDPDPVSELRRLLDAASVWPIAEDWRALVDAELGGVDGTGTDVASWDAAVAACRPRSAARRPAGLLPPTARRSADLRRGQAGRR